MSFWSRYLVLIFASIILPLSVAFYVDTQSEKERAARTGAVAAKVAAPALRGQLQLQGHQVVGKALALAGQISDENLIADLAKPQRKADATRRLVAMVDDLGDFGKGYIWVVDATGGVLVRSGHGSVEEKPELITGHPLFQATQEGYALDGFWIHEGQLFIVGAAPLVSQGTSGGAILVGKAIDKNTVQQLGRAISGDLTLVMNKRKIASTLPDDIAGIVVDEVAQTLEPVLGGKLNTPLEHGVLPFLPIFVSPRAEGLAYTSIASQAPGSEGVRWVISIPSAEGLNGLATRQEILLGVMLAAVLIAVVIGLVLQRTFVSPIESLADRLAEIQQGRGDREVHEYRYSGPLRRVVKLINAIIQKTPPSRTTSTFDGATPLPRSPSQLGGPAPFAESFGVSAPPGPGMPMGMGMGGPGMGMGGPGMSMGGPGMSMGMGPPGMGMGDPNMPMGMSGPPGMGMGMGGPPGMSMGDPNMGMGMGDPNMGMGMGMGMGGPGMGMGMGGPQGMGMGDPNMQWPPPQQGGFPPQMGYDEEPPLPGQMGGGGPAPMSMGGSGSVDDEAAAFMAQMQSGGMGGLSQSAPQGLTATPLNQSQRSAADIRGAPSSALDSGGMSMSMGGGMSGVPVTGPSGLPIPSAVPSAMPRGPTQNRPPPPVGLGGPEPVVRMGGATLGPPPTLLGNGPNVAPPGGVTDEEEDNAGATMVGKVSDELLQRSMRDHPAPANHQNEDSGGADRTMIATASITEKLRDKSRAEDAADADGLDGADHAHFKETYDRFVEMRRACGEPTNDLAYDRFVAKLKKNRDGLIKKYNCRTVRFQVYQKEGKAALKATPVRQGEAI